MYDRGVSVTFQPPLDPTHLTHRTPQQSRCFNLRPLASDYQRHHFQNVSFTLTHLNPVFLHPGVTNRTLLSAEDRTFLSAYDIADSSPLTKSV
jgi:hypothetical protein